MDFLTELFIDGVADVADAVADHLINKKINKHFAGKLSLPTKNKPHSSSGKNRKENKEELPCQSKV